MSDSQTDNFNWVKPEVGASPGSWGTKLNATLDDIDGDLQDVKDTADGALQRGGGTASGAIIFGGDVTFDADEGFHYGTPIAAAPSGSAVALDLAVGHVFDIGTYAGTALSLNFSNRPAGGLHPVVVIGRFTAASGSEETGGNSSVGCDVTVDSGDASFSFIAGYKAAFGVDHTIAFAGVKTHTVRWAQGYAAIIVYVQGS